MTGIWLICIAALLLAYEMGRLRLARHGVGWPSTRRACWYAAAALVAVALLPPLGIEAGRHIWAETLQFALLAFGAAPLFALGAPFGLLVERPSGRKKGSGPLGWATRPGWSLALIAYLTVTIVWRLPVAVDAVAAGREWLALEAVSLVGGSWWLWASLVGSTPRQALDKRPLRIALSAVATWSVWVFAYVVGFSAHAFYPAFAVGSPMGAQEVAVGILWATSAAAFCPVIFVNLTRWLVADQAEAEAEMAAYRPRSSAVGRSDV